MALKKSFTFNGIGRVEVDGIVFEKGAETYIMPEAYIKIESLTGTKEMMSFDVSFTSQNNGAIRNKNFSYSFVPAVSEGSENFIKQAYEYLKTLPDFAGATNC